MNINSKTLEKRMKLLRGPLHAYRANPCPNRPAATPSSPESVCGFMLLRRFNTIPLRHHKTHPTALVLPKHLRERKRGSIISCRGKS